jgi:DNA-binding Lrp family transcriptional regulator
MESDALMITAILLIKTERDKIVAVAETLADIAGISEVYSVAGRYDLVAMLRVRQAEDMARLVTSEIGKVAGIVETETLVAFRAYSRHDLEAAFSLGSDD